MAIRTLALMFLTIPAGWMFVSHGDEQAKGPSVAELIKKLDSPKYAERERAMQMLKKAGPGALPELRKAQVNAVLETSVRLGQLIEHLETQAAFEPSRITLHAKGKPLAEVLKQIEEQTGNRVKVDDQFARYPVTLELSSATFWEAIGQIEKQCRLAISAEANANRFYFTKERGRSDFTINAGAFRLELVKLHDSREIEFTKLRAGNKSAKPSGLLTLSLSLYIEPKMLMCSVGHPIIESAIDEFGEPFGTLASPSAPEQITRSDYIDKIFVDRNLNLQLVRPSKKSVCIRSIRIALPIGLVDRKQVLLSTNLLDASAKKIKVAGSSLEFVSATRSEKGHYHVSFRLQPKTPRFDDRWMHRIHLEDAAGSRYQLESISVVNVPNEWSFSIHFSAGKNKGLGTPQNLYVEDWIVRSRVIAFEFKDIPLP